MDLFDLTWRRDRAGYELIVPKGSDKVWVAGRGGEIEEYQPLKCFGLYRCLADCGLSRKAVADFHNRFGPLLVAETEGTLLYPLELFKTHVREARTNVRIADAERWEDLAGRVNRYKWFGQMSAEFQASDGPFLKFVPQSLLAAMGLQFALDLSTGARLRKCQFCSDWFKYGTGTGKRETAIYCSPKCQKAHAYRRAKAKMAVP